jgi:CheY-like chemotaxis protein
MQLETLQNPVVRKCRDVIDRQITQVTRLVDDLLDVGRLTTGKIKLRKELVRVSDVVHRSVETVRPVIESRRHRLELDVPDAPIYVSGDSVRLAQIVQNLLVNAARYTPEGGFIRVKAAEADGFVNIVVSDNGRGITPEQLERIFDLFVQAETGVGGESGLGIGLTLARTLSEMHGGSLDASSPGLGQGSSFTVRLPAASAPEAEPAKEGESPSGGLRVLVVDDNRDSADSATDILRLLGHTVECAYDGASAVDIAQRFHPRVIMLDLAMPGMDGFETRRRLRAHPGLEDAFLIAMTGYGNEDDKRLTKAAGFDAHLTKPVELDALISLLNEAQGSPD